jgi:hypothetical protein
MKILQSFGKSVDCFSGKLAHYNNNYLHNNDTIMAGVLLALTVKGAGVI